MVKNLPALWDTRVQSLGQEDLIQKGMAHTLVFWLEELHGQRILVSHSPRGHKELDMTA